MKKIYKLIIFLSLVGLVSSCDNSSKDASQKNTIRNENSYSEQKQFKFKKGYIVKFKSPALSETPETKFRSRAVSKFLRNKNISFQNERQTVLDCLNQISKNAYNKAYINNSFKHDYRNLINGVAIELTSSEKEKISKLNSVAKVYYDHELELLLKESVPLIKADQVWRDYGFKGNGVVVAVIDTGIDYMHPDLGGGFGKGFKVIGGYDFLDNDADPMDIDGHGTHCAGIIAANGKVKGVAPEAKLMAFRVATDLRKAYMSTTIAALERAYDPDQNPATDDKVDVVSMSLGTIMGSPEDILAQAVNSAVTKGITVVISAGNDGQRTVKTINSPGCAKDAITVGASTNLDKITAFSSIGPNKDLNIKPEVVAPGFEINSTIPGNKYAVHSGTSMSAPHVAGVAALLLEKRPNLTPYEVKGLLQNSAKDIRYPLMYQGAGRVDALNAVTSEMIVTPGSYSFKNLNNPQPGNAIVVENKTFTIKNLSNKEKRYSISKAELPVVNGVRYYLTETLVVPALSSKDFTLQLTVNQGLLIDGEYSGKIGLKDLSTNVTTRVPVYFAKKSIIYTELGRENYNYYNFMLRFQELPTNISVTVTDPSGVVTNLDPKFIKHDRLIYDFQTNFKITESGNYLIKAVSTNSNGSSNFFKRSVFINYNPPQLDIKTSINNKKVEIDIKSDQIIDGYWNKSIKNLTFNDNMDNHMNGSAVNSMVSVVDSKNRVHLFWIGSNKELGGGFLSLFYKYSTDYTTNSWSQPKLINKYCALLPNINIDKEDIIHLSFLQNHDLQSNLTKYILNYMQINAADGSVKLDPQEYFELSHPATDVFHLNRWKHRSFLDQNGKLHIVFMYGVRNSKKYIRINTANAKIEELRNDIGGSDIYVDKNSVAHMIYTLPADIGKTQYTTYDLKTNLVKTSFVDFTLCESSNTKVQLRSVELEADKDDNIYFFALGVNNRNHKCALYAMMAAPNGNLVLPGLPYFDTSTYYPLEYNRSFIVRYNEMENRFQIVFDKALEEFDNPTIVTAAFCPINKYYPEHKELYSLANNESYGYFNLLFDSYGNKHIIFKNYIKFRIYHPQYEYAYMQPTDQIKIMSFVNSPLVFLTNSSGEKIHVPMLRKRYQQKAFLGSCQLNDAGDYVVDTQVHNENLDYLKVSNDIQVLDAEIKYNILDWDSGCQLSFSIKNTGTTPINNWSFDFEFDKQFKNGWEATYIQNGKQVTVYPPHWDTVIKPGEVANFGFIGYPGDVFFQPRFFNLKSNQ